MRTKSEFSEDRDKDLLRAFNEVLRSYPVKSQSEAIKIALQSRSKRYWVTPESTYKAICRISRGDDLYEMKPGSRAMYLELYQMFCKEKTRDPSIPSAQICEVIVERQASRFYITYGTAVKIINRKRKEEQCKKLNLLSQLRRLP